MISFSSACLILKRLPVFPKVVSVPLSEASGRILAQDIHAVEDSPAFHKSLMDGYAVRSRDTSGAPVSLLVKGRALAGKPFSGTIASGTCAGVATGAVLPRGADAVVRKEDGEIKGPFVFLKKSVSEKTFVLARGSEYAKGAKILAKGSLLGPRQTALLASQGWDFLKTFEQPRVAVLITGHELVLGKEKCIGCIRDATGPMLISFLKQMGLSPLVLGYAGDDLPALRKKIRPGLSCDILITTGGVSVGEKDLVPQAFKDEGVVCRFHKVAMRPGKPVWFGTKRKCHVFGLPGNPVSSLMGFLLFVKPLLNRMQGGTGRLDFCEGILSRGAENPEERLAFLPCRLKTCKHQTQIIPLDFKGSSDLLSMARADGFFRLEPFSRQRPGSPVAFLKI